MTDHRAAVLLNDTLDWTRGKRAAHAVHAVLHLYGVAYAHPVVVLNGKRLESEQETTGKLALSSGLVLAVATLRGPSGEGEELTITVDNTRAKTRNETANAAVQVALQTYNKPPVRIDFISSSEKDILTEDIVIRDQGRTELEPGTVTAGARWLTQDIQPDPSLDPTGTLRRVRAENGFAHVIALTQPEGDPRWMMIDAYGEMPGDSILTDEQVRDMPVVYTPVSSEDWKATCDG